jgi:hypothetical protein
MTPRIVLILGYLGLVFFVLGAAWLMLGFTFFCIMGCPSAATVPDGIQRGLTYFGRFALPGIAILLLAWPASLELLARARLWRRFVAVLAMPLGGLGLAALCLFAAWRSIVETAARADPAVWGTTSGPMWQEAFPAWMGALWLTIAVIIASAVMVIGAGHAAFRATRSETEAMR